MAVADLSREGRSHGSDGVLGVSRSHAVLTTAARTHAPGGAVLPVTIAGLGTDLPARVVSNDELAAGVMGHELDTGDDWIRSRTGIGRRHVAAPEDATSDLAIRAGRRALADADVAAADLSAVIVATTSPDHVLPGTAPIVGAALGTSAAAFDLNAACSGFVYGLRTAGALAATGAAPVLLIGAETLSRIVDWRDRGTAVLFADGAAAAVLTPHGEPTIGPFDLGADGTDPTALWCEAGGSRTPVSAEDVRTGRNRISMRGREIYRRAVEHMTASSQRVLGAAGLTVADVDLVVAHQANQRILAAVARRLGVPEDRMHLSVEMHGNTSAASVPLALADARAAGRLHPGDRVLLTAFGAGLTWGSCLLTWHLPAPGQAPSS